MSELRDQLEAEVKRIIDEPMTEPFPVKPPELETDGVFDADLERPAPAFLNEIGEFLDNPAGAILQMLAQSLEALRPRAYEPIKSEHKVKIFRLNDRTVLAEVEAEIEAFLNDGYCCHMPAVCGDFLIMDFSRRKENEQNGREQ